MKLRTKKILKWSGIILGSLLIIIVAIGIYIYSLIPKYQGDCPPLQAELFSKPQQDLPMEGKYIYKSASELAAMIRNGKATSYDIVQEYIANIKNNNYKYNAIIWLQETEALAEAKKADEKVARGDTLLPLLGVPVTVKEMFWIKGLTNNMNAKMMGGFIAPKDGALVTQLKKSGAIILGSSNVPYLLGDFQTYGEIYPTCNNPYDTTLTPGGSSGGSAAALAAGFTALELGSDLGGSISVPAAFCGVYGLKPTFGTLNITEGTGPDTITKFTRFAMAVAGPMARTVEDVELMWMALRDMPLDSRFQKPIVWKSASDKSLENYRIAWTDDWQTAVVGNDVKEKLQMLIQLLQSNGTITEKKMPELNTAMLDSYFKGYALMMNENQPWVMRQLISMDFKKFDDGSVDMSAFFKVINHPQNENWFQWQTENDDLISTWEIFFRQFDFAILPVTYGPAFTKCKMGTPISIKEGEIPYSKYLIPYSTVFAATGNPSLTIPLGLNKAGLPIAVQIVGPYYSEPELLHFAKLVEKLLPPFQVPD